MSYRKQLPKNGEIDIFKLHRDDKNNEYKMEIIFEPIQDNLILYISKEEYNDIYRIYNHIRKPDIGNTTIFTDNMFDESAMANYLRRRYKKDFKMYYKAFRR